MTHKHLPWPLWAFFAVAMARNFGLAAVMFIDPRAFSANGFSAALRVAPEGVWALAMLATACVLLVGVVARSLAVVRLGLTASSVVLLMFAATFTLSLVGHIAGAGVWTRPIVYVSLALKDMLIASLSFVAIDDDAGAVSVSVATTRRRRSDTT